CPNLRKFQLKQAATFADRSPCTNHPIQCEFCPENSPAVWKYNLQSHILDNHPTASIERQEKRFKVTEQEQTLMKAVFLMKPRMSRKKKLQFGKLKISEGH
ncbi:hypothetical protein BDQ17DRAFT_1170323, partial [Cyathus striatus]